MSGGEQNYIRAVISTRSLYANELALHDNGVRRPVGPHPAEFLRRLGGKDRRFVRSLVNLDSAGTSMQQQEHVVLHFMVSISITVSVPFTLSARNFTLSPALTLSSIAGSLTMVFQVKDPAMLDKVK